jgi:Spy/CpxP family protein refolding chaperone
MRMPIRCKGGRGWGTKALGLALPVLAALSLAALAQARPGGQCEGHGGHGRHGGPGLEQLERKVEDLDLSDEKRKAIYAVIDQARSAERESRREIRTGRERMRELLSQETPQEKEVLALADSIGALETNAQKARLRTLLQIRGLVTPEQWEQLQPWRGHHGMHHRGPGPMPGAGPGPQTEGEGARL